MTQGDKLSDCSPACVQDARFSARRKIWDKSGRGFPVVWLYFQCQTPCIPSSHRLSFVLRPLAGFRLFSVPDPLHTYRRLSFIFNARLVAYLSPALFIFSARLLTFHGLRNARAEALINEGLLVRDFFITECDKEMTPRLEEHGKTLLVSQSCHLMLWSDYKYIH